MSFMVWYFKHSDTSSNILSFLLLRLVHNTTQHVLCVCGGGRGGGECACVCRNRFEFYSFVGWAKYCSGYMLYLKSFSTVFKKIYLFLFYFIKASNFVFKYCIDEI